MKTDRPRIPPEHSVPTCFFCLSFGLNLVAGERDTNAFARQKKCRNAHFWLVFFGRAGGSFESPLHRAPKMEIGTSSGARWRQAKALRRRLPDITVQKMGEEWRSEQVFATNTKKTWGRKGGARAETRRMVMQSGVALNRSTRCWCRGAPMRSDS